MPRSVMVIVLAVLWAPVTWHCKLESLPGLEFLRCPSDTPSRSDCAGDGCQVVESGLYKPEDNQRAIPLAVDFALLTEALSASERLALPQLVVSGETVSPPELPRSWQFSFRAALPPRAPSFA